MKKTSIPIVTHLVAYILQEPTGKSIVLVGLLLFGFTLCLDL